MLSSAVVTGALRVKFCVSCFVTLDRQVRFAFHRILVTLLVVKFTILLINKKNAIEKKITSKLLAKEKCS